MSNTKTPLWKQLAGALAGAAVALVLYEGYTFTSDHLQAIVALPTAPGVSHQDQLGFSTTADPDTTARLLARQRQIAQQIGGYPGGTSSSSSSTVTATRTPVPGISSTPSLFPGPVGTAEQQFHSSSSDAGAGVGVTAGLAVSSSSSSDNTIFYGPNGSLRGLKKFFGWGTSSWSSSSASSLLAVLPPAPAGPAAAVVGGIQNAAIQQFFSSASSSLNAGLPFPQIVQQVPVSSSGMAGIMNAPNIPSPPPPAVLPIIVPADPGIIPASSTNMPSFPMQNTVQPPMPSLPPPIVPAPKPLVASVVQKGNADGRKNLPKSGFGLDIVAVAAIGAVIGRKKAKKA